MKAPLLIALLAPTLAFADIVETAKGDGSAAALAFCKHGKAVNVSCLYESSGSKDTPVYGQRDELKGVVCIATGDGPVTATAVVKCESRAEGK